MRRAQPGVGGLLLFVTVTTAKLDTYSDEQPRSLDYGDRGGRWFFRFQSNFFCLFMFLRSGPVNVGRAMCFTSGSIVFASSTPNNRYCTIIPTSPTSLSQTGMAGVLRSRGYITIISTSPSTTFHSFTTSFARVRTTNNIIIGSHNR